MTDALSLSKQRPPGVFKHLSGFATMFMNNPSYWSQAESARSNRYWSSLSKTAAAFLGRRKWI